MLYGPLGFLFALAYGNVTEQFAKDPGEIWVVARTVAAVSAWRGGGHLLAARRLWGVREGLVAAAVLAFAFLPVAYSRVAVTDVGALDRGGARADVVGARRRGRPRCATTRSRGRPPAWRSLQVHGRAGAAAARHRGAGAAAGRPACGRWPGSRWPAGGRALVFALLNPYVFGSLGDWWTDLRDQADVAADEPKPGQETGGLSYYVEQPHLGARLGGDRGGAGGRRAACCAAIWCAG